MKIIFKENDEAKKIVFADVKIEQFFVDKHGFLCQKYSCDAYNLVADQDGVLKSGRFDEICRHDIINSVLPEISRIEF